MKALLDIYIRSLLEREDKPESHQDLGSFICWLLERLGFTIHLLAYKYEGIERRVSKGRKQQGVDILATKPDKNGEELLYRFVLKRGKVGTAEWSPGSPGTMIHDLWLAAGKPIEEDAQHILNFYTLFSNASNDRIVVAAIHNGDLDTEAVGNQLIQLRRDMKNRHRVHLLWWDAIALLSLTTETPSNQKLSLFEESDTTLFPPENRPFMRLALDSLLLDKSGVGSTFRLDAIDLLIDNALPHNRTLENNLGESIPIGPNTEPTRFYRTLSELGLFVSMLQVDCKRYASGSCLPSLDTIERLLCRTFELIWRSNIGQLKTHEKRLKILVQAIGEEYISLSESLKRKLLNLAHIPFGLSSFSKSESIDYSLRVFQFFGYLAVAGIACLEYDKIKEAESFAQCIKTIWLGENFSELSPITDDQIIEMSLVWTLWLKLGWTEEVSSSALSVINNFLYRKMISMPLPAVWQRARKPMLLSDIEILVETYIERYESSPPSFSDSSSTILPLAIFLAHQLNSLKQPDLLNWIQSENGLSLQAWMPPDDAFKEWYLHEIKYRGHTIMFEFKTDTLDEFVSQFTTLNQPIQVSIANTWSVSYIDCIAWKLWRTPPPMSSIIELVS